MEDLKGTISLADYFSDKSFWFNNEGVHIASGKPGINLNTTLASTFGHNVLIDDQSLSIRYDDRLLSEWTEDSINFYNIYNEESTARIATFGQEGLKLLEGIIQLGDINVNGNISTGNGIFINYNTFLARNEINNGEETVVNMLSLSSNGFILNTPSLTISNENVSFQNSINISSFLYNENYVLNFKENNITGFYLNDSTTEGHPGDPVLTFTENEVNANVIKITKRLVFTNNTINSENQNAHNIAFIMRENNHLSLKLT